MNYIQTFKMIAMKYVWLILCLFISGLTPALHAQTPPKPTPETIAKFKPANPEERAKQMTDKLKADISLSEEQYQQALEININAAKKNVFTGTVEENQRKLQELQSERWAAILSILSPEQQQKYRELYPEPVFSEPEGQ
jgi:hypothetical protein